MSKILFSVVLLVSCLVLCFSDEPPAEDEEDVASSEYPTPEPVEYSLRVVAELNENLTLSCTGLPNVTVYQVIMERLVSDQSWAIIGVCKTVEAALLSEDYSERGTISCDHSLDVSLQLLHVQQEDSGVYRCTFHTETGVHSTTMTLSVSESGVEASTTRHHTNLPVTTEDYC